MTARDPLFEFMPYGAPELLAAQRPHLLRALAFASGLALAAFALMHSLGLTVTADRPVTIDLERPGVVLDVPPSVRVWEPVSPRTTLPAKAGTTGAIEPVPDEAAPKAGPVVTRDGGSASGVEGGAEPQARDVPPGPGTIAEDVIPKVDDYVYVDELPAAAKIVEPAYPELAKDAGIEGRVYVHILVGKDGRVMRAEVDPKFSVLMLDEAALSAARQWTFTPGFVNGHPVAVWVGQMFVFTLHR